MSPQVLHGCLQFMSSDVWLSPLMNANPTSKNDPLFTLFSTGQGEGYSLDVCLLYKDNNGTKTNLYDPYAMGYRRAAQTTTM